MAWFSYHGGHSGQYCRHAKGTLHEVVERAIELGFTSYGLSEHAPRVRQRDLFPEEQGLSVDQLDRMFAAYVTEARGLQQEFQDRLDLLVGFETEALPEQTEDQEGSWRTLMPELRSRHGFDYIVGSVHTVAGIPIDFSPARTLEAERLLGGWDALCQAYYQQVRELVEWLRPEVTGHLDLIRRFRGQDVGLSAEVWPQVEAALQTVKRVGSLLEVNSAPARRGFGPVYPCPQILARARELEIPVTLGDDSHGPQDVGGDLQACIDALRQAGYDAVGALSTRAGEGAQIVMMPIDDLKPRSASGHRA